MANKVEFGLLLAKYRTRYGWSQSELAAKISMSRGAVASWESGDIPNTRSVVMRMAEELNLSKEERKELLQAAGMSIEHWPAEYWTVPFHRNRSFVGREAVLQTLQQTLVPGKTTALTQSISGLGGVGKTQVAIEYAHRYGECYEAVLWIQADSQEVATAEYLQLATQVLGLPVQPEATQQIEAVKRWLQKRHGWLLIFDNVEDPQALLSTFVPSKYQGSVLLTTRRRDVGTLAHNEILPVFSEQEAILFLLRRAKRIARTAEVKEATYDDFHRASELCQLLGWLPLALDQAGAYIEENGCSFQHYLDLYQQFKPKLLDRRKADKQLSDRKGNNDHPESVFMTFWLSWDQIQQRNLPAGKALEFCAFLAPNQIPEPLVLDGIRRGDEKNPPEALVVDEALGLLYRYSLIERTDQTLSLHRLVQEVMREVLSEEERQYWMERAVMVINAAFPNGEYGTWSECESLLPHALLCANWLKDIQQKPLGGARLLNDMGHYLYERGRYREAEPLLQRALLIREEQLGPTHPDTAASLNNLALLYQAQGRYEEAEPLFQRALAIAEKQLGPSHLDAARGLNNLALLYQSQGRYKEAEPILKRALAIVEEQLGPSHPQMAASLNNLAALYQAQGLYEKVEPLYQRALAIREEQLGPSHPQMAVSLNNLAMLYKDQGCYKEADPLLQRALAIAEEQLGPSHPQTAASLDNLARLYQDQGLYEEAEPLYQRALAIREEQLGPSHYQTATSLNNLAALYQDQESYEEAKTLLQRALAIKEEQLGPTHPDTAASLNNLAMLYQAQGRYEEAEPLLQRAANTSFACLGEEHPQTQQIIRNYLMLSADKYTNGDMDALLRLLEQRKQGGNNENGEEKPE